MSESTGPVVGVLALQGDFEAHFSDSSGDVASTYQIPALPFTAIIGPNGTLETLHPGAMTTEQLEYVVKNLNPALMRD